MCVHITNVPVVYYVELMCVSGERRIRVHTLCLPVTNSLTDVINSADQQAIIGLLSKMGAYPVVTA